MTTIYTKEEFLKRFRKVRFGKITEPLVDSFWRNNLARARKKVIGEHGPEPTIVFYSLDDPNIDVEQTLKRNRNLWIVDDQGHPLIMPGIESPLESLPQKQVKQTIDKLEEAEQPDYQRYPAGWMGGEWEGYDTSVQTIQDTSAWLAFEFETGRYPESDVVIVIVEALVEYFRAVTDSKEGKKYKPGDLLTEDDQIDLDRKSKTVDLLNKVLKRLKSDVKQLKGGKDV